MRRLSACRKGLLALLALSALLRLTLAVRGGQRFFPDENRYLRSFILLRDLEGGRPGAALDYLLTSPDHTGFILVGLAPAFLQQALVRAAGWQVGRPTLDLTAGLPAALLSAFSLCSIALVFGLAGRLGAGEGEALLAAGLMSASSVMLYYSRHLFPYDVALALGLLALWLGLRERASPTRSLLVGLVAGSALLVYNGYWLSVAAALALHSLVGARSFSECARRAAWSGLGAGAWLALTSALSASRGLGIFARRMARFSRLASTDADLSEGWSLPWAYLWHAEHGLLFAFAAAALLLLLDLAAPASGARDEPAVEPGRRTAERGRVWLLTALALYAALVVMSNGFGRVGVFGRQVRQLVPFLCLASAAAAVWVASRVSMKPWLKAACGLALGIQAGFNFAPLLQQRFPRDVVRELSVRYGPLDHAASLVCAADPEAATPKAARYVLLNARHLHFILAPVGPPEGRELYRTRHPQEYRPYQYEGLVPMERSLLRSTDVSIRLIEPRAP